MRCPDCNKKQRSKELLKLGHCKKCGRKHKIKDFILQKYYDEIFKPITIEKHQSGHIQKGPTITYTYGEL